MTFAEKRKYYNILFIIFFTALLSTMFLSSTIGAVRISFFDSIRIVLGKIPLVNMLVNTDGIEATHKTIVLVIRMPEIVLSAIVGAGLSVVGAAFQGIFRNPMADPYVMGISSGAALGATIAMVTGLGGVFLGFGTITLFAFAGAIITITLVYNIARVGSRIPSVTLILAGVAVSFFIYSIIYFMMMFNRDKIERIVFWTMGSLSSATWGQTIILFPVIITGTLVIIMFGRDLNIMSTGDDAARSLGINVETVKKILLGVSSMVVASCVSVGGIIGFVGLVIPHIVRIVFGSDHRVVLPFSALLGAIFMVVCDTAARTLMIPVGVITSMIGAPFFIYLLMKSKKKVI